MERGRPKGSFKYFNDNKEPISVYQWRRLYKDNWEEKKKVYGYMFKLNKQIIMELIKLRTFENESCNEIIGRLIVEKKAYDNLIERIIKVNKIDSNVIEESSLKQIEIPIVEEPMIEEPMIEEPKIEEPMIEEPIRIIKQKPKSFLFKNRIKKEVK